MNITLYTLYHILRADFWERVRRYSFLIVLGIIVYAGYLFVPPVNVAYATLVRGSYRALYNSAGVGNLFGSVAVILLPLFGFFLVKNSITRDYQTGVGQIIATTPISKSMYLLGKWLSDLAVLALILIVLTMMALVMQLVRAEDSNIHLWKLIAPIWLMGLPVLAIWSAFAVAFESIPFLRGGFGNVVAVFLWAGILGAWAPSFAMLATPSNDLLGITRPTASIQRQILAIDPNADIGTGGMFWFNIPGLEGQDDRAVSIFTWDGLDWTGDIFLERLMWLGVGLLIALTASIPFDRFDPSRRKRIQNKSVIAAVDSSPEKSIESNNKDIRLSALDQQYPRWRFFGILLVELRLTLKGQKLIWYLINLGLIIAMLVSPLDIVQSYLFPLACLWPMLLWSGMGGREKQFQTEALVLSIAYPLRRQLPATWFAGVVIGLIATGIVGIRFAMTGQWEHVMAWSIGILFVPSFALALGIWSGGSKLFEISFVILWYLGILQHIPMFDFFGMTDLALASNAPILYALLVLLLVGVAIAGRWKQLRN
jgi:ABC-type transport system involved in multi-copper enzyme maturation permease subunit